MNKSVSIYALYSCGPHSAQGRIPFSTKQLINEAFNDNLLDILRIFFNSFHKGEIQKKQISFSEGAEEPDYALTLLLRNMKS